MKKDQEESPGLILDDQQVSRSVEALLKYLEAKKDKQDLLEESEPIVLQICMKCVPSVKNKIIKCRLPHTLVLPTTDICLFVRDLDKKKRDYEPTEDHFQELLDKNSIKCVSKILPMKAIKLEYQPYEAKRNLSDMYDIFLADANIVRLLPGFLGKNFYDRKRFPLQINLDSEDLKKEFEKTLHISQCIIGGRGSSCQVAVGHTGMKSEHLIENVKKAVSDIVVSLPGGAPNVRNLHIRTGNSPSLPIYISVGGEAEVSLPSNKRPMESVTEEVDVVNGAKVRVLADGRLRFIKDGEDVSKRRGKKVSKAAKLNKAAKLSANKKLKAGKLKIKAKPTAAQKMKSSKKNEDKTPVDKSSKTEVVTTAVTDKSVKSKKSPKVKSDIKQPMKLTKFASKSFGKAQKQKSKSKK